MSAWRVSQKHIDCLVSGAVKLGLIYPKDADETGRMLWLENYRSVDFRYNQTKPLPFYTWTMFIVDDSFLSKQIHCYEYQSCEHPEWEESDAAALCMAMSEIIGNHRHTPSYEASPWGV